MDQQQKTFPLIGIIGKSGHGKDTLCEQIQEHGFVQYEFARPLKSIALVLGFKDAEINGTQEQKLSINEHWGISGRTFLQIFGTEVARIDLPKHLPTMSNIWIKLFEIKCETMKMNPTSGLVISDVRFKNEADAIKRAGGVLIKIRGDYKLWDMPSENEEHSSETQLIDICSDYHIENIENIGTLDELYKTELFIKCKFPQLYTRHQNHHVRKKEEAT